jgi:hypothetical protein
LTGPAYYWTHGSIRVRAKALGALKACQGFSFMIRILTDLYTVRDSTQGSIQIRAKALAVKACQGFSLMIRNIVRPVYCQGFDPRKACQGFSLMTRNVDRPAYCQGFNPKGLQVLIMNRLTPPPPLLALFMQVCSGYIANNSGPTTETGTGRLRFGVLILLY